MESANTVIEIPAWAWTLLGGAAVLLGGKAVQFVLDVILIQFKGKDAQPNPSGGAAPHVCTSTCRIQWESQIAAAIATAKTEIGTRIDAGFERVHDRIDEVMRGR